MCTSSWLPAVRPAQEEEKLHTLAASSSLSTSSNGSLSSGLTSGYNSSIALLSDQLQSPDSVVSGQMLAMSHGPEPLRQVLRQEVLPLGGCR